MGWMGKDSSCEACLLCQASNNQQAKLLVSTKLLTDVMLLGGCGKSMENQRKMNVKLLMLYVLALIIFMTVMCNHKPCRNCHCSLGGLAAGAVYAAFVSSPLRSGRSK